VVHLYDIWKGLVKAGTREVRILTINTAATAGSVMELGKGTTLPVLQDSYEANVWGVWGAGKDATWVLDRNGYIRSYWSFLDFNTGQDTLIAAIQSALAL